MEGFLEGVGVVILVFLALVGLAAGWIAGKIAGRNMPLYIVIGVVAAVATPFVLAALGVGILAAGGLLVVVVAGAIGAVIVLALVRALTGRRG
ncbi:GlsB/YeaQ/YmgE family stress response membrane protein [Palleronia abyssalis]|uniref:GlsB/YeaQ/YmgE family stress response membrane protein n=1 Tax=Palleronia abyssalis TaxID=1501240 RepID=A0A2R8BYF4_9RHOB|nr:GlsB/YeaQ/YmgE family stress response membrane protein [Palleronia abyssalis]SPJ25106.1 hypothetical protein PAA8504_02952 [Palleronia abyssalis]